MAVKLAPLPKLGTPFDSLQWQIFFNSLNAFATTAGGVAWTAIDFTGSNLTSILTRNHNDLVAIQGGSSGNRYHLDVGQAVALTGTGGTSTQTGNYSALSTDELILCNANSAGFTVTLPTAVGIQGKTYFLKKTDSTNNVVTVATSGGQTIDGLSTLALSTKNAMYVIESDNANWWVDAFYGNRTTTSQNSNYTVTLGVNLVLVDISGGSVTITLPTAVGIKGLKITIKMSVAGGGNTLTVAAAGGQNIDGAATYTGLVAQYNSVMMESDGSNWWIIAKV